MSTTLPAGTALDRLSLTQIGAIVVLATAALARTYSPNDWWDFVGGVATGVLAIFPLLVIQRWRKVRQLETQPGASTDVSPLLDERQVLVRQRSSRIAGSFLTAYLVVGLIAFDLLDSPRWIESNPVLVIGLGLLLSKLLHLASMLWLDRESA